MGAETVVAVVGAGAAGTAAIVELIRRLRMPSNEQVDQAITQDRAAVGLVPGGRAGRGWVYRPLGPAIYSDAAMHRLARNEGVHAGLDIVANEGTRVSVARSGIVIAAGPQSGYGNRVIVKHRGGVTTLYAHMSRIDVAAGAVIAGGDAVGLVGRTSDARGGTTGFPTMGAHLHFSVHRSLPSISMSSGIERQYGTEPLAWLGGQGTAISA